MNDYSSANELFARTANHLAMAERLPLIHPPGDQLGAGFKVGWRTAGLVPMSRIFYYEKLVRLSFARGVAKAVAR